MCVTVVVAAQPRQGSLAVIYIPGYMQISLNLDGPIVLQLDETARLVEQPELADRNVRWGLYVRVCTANNETMLRVALLRDNEDLITWRRRTTHAPTGANPRREYRQPASQYTLRLQGDLRRRGRRVNRRHYSEARLAASLIKRPRMLLDDVKKLLHRYGTIPCDLDEALWAKTC